MSGRQRQAMAPMDGCLRRRARAAMRAATWTAMRAAVRAAATAASTRSRSQQQRQPRTATCGRLIIASNAAQLEIFGAKATSCPRPANHHKRNGHTREHCQCQQYKSRIKQEHSLQGVCAMHGGFDGFSAYAGERSMHAVCGHRAKSTGKNQGANRWTSGHHGAFLLRGTGRARCARTIWSSCGELGRFGDAKWTTFWGLNRHSWRKWCAQRGYPGSL